MRVLSWNINGVRTLPNYHPWNTYKEFDEILNALNADIICFQEMKSSRQGLTKQVALPSSYDSFFSFHARKSGYSGTAIYTRRDTLVPLKAEEGLTGILQPKPPLSTDEKISRTYPPAVELNDREEDDAVDWKDLDSEGRAVVVDLGLFVLINTYCPNDGTGTEEREKFKMDYHRLLETRVNCLIKEGRQVMVVGDLNACAAIEDHCEGQLMVERGLAEGLEGEEGFWGKEYRRWIRDWLIKEDGTGGSMVDIVRKFWPDRKGMYTCWNTKISARDTNYGTRIDFILITPGLVPWIKAADIQPQLKGSDHCPVYVDFHDEIVDVNGVKTRLADALGARPTAGGRPAEPPRLAAKHWDEFKQKSLATFFGKKKGEVSKSSPSQTPPVVPPASMSRQTSQMSDVSTPSASPIVVDDDAPAISTAPSMTLQDKSSSAPIVTTTTSEHTTSIIQTSHKRKLVPESPDTSSKKPKPIQVQKKKEGPKQAGQTTLAGFFSQPKASVSSSSSKSKSKPTKSSSSVHPNLTTTTAAAAATQDQVEPLPIDVDEDADYQYALLLSQSDDAIPPSSSQGSSFRKQGQGKDQEKKKQAWDSLLAPTQTPVCTVHNEPAKEYTVNKPGPNKGKRFFICSRPVGPGYDKGRAERLREQVDPQWKCNYFKWSSDVRKEMAKKGHS
ncbi:hypothetical protein D9613_006552 [Agrocybe pediades]|uniref:DNA-(apurinic or apyrimidinic site) endonuclease 2 n=1 Tax=Agrocybe pediades TaxID=84607 RepID=A0A8H4QG76_9AGAR|nr:hypothetical protein D9613_006552 [Agrocybe pediades]